MTPNPCIECNRYLKFDKLFQRAKELDYDYVVTGHYAISYYDEAKGRYMLKKAVDDTKDQSYVLYSLTQDQLAHIQFPLGTMTKMEARDVAEKNGFVNARKHDSQDICFVTNGKYAEFIEGFTGKAYPEGNFVNSRGEVLGTHKGIIRYTIGQRKGLGLALKEPMYVMDVDTDKNQVMLGRNDELFSRELYANDINLISVERIEEPMRVKAKVRYRAKEDWATVTQTSDDTIHVVFDNPQRAITKGQAVVLYDGDNVVGGGTVIKVDK
jgi:tRNA-specific 2-thiouridylase